MIPDIRNATATSADLYFYGDIVSSWWGAWDDADQYPDNIKNFLDGVKNVPNLNIYINSGGGAVFAGMAIYNMLKRHKAHKTVYVDGLAASIASVIALAGDKVIIPSNAYFMMHKPLIWGYGNAVEMRKMADDLDKIEEGILNVYCDRLRSLDSREEIHNMMQNETWLTGEDAAKFFNVEVSAGKQAVACASEFCKEFKNIPEGLFAPAAKASTPSEPDNSLERAKAKLKIYANQRRD